MPRQSHGKLWGWGQPKCGDGGSWNAGVTATGRDERWTHERRQELWRRNCRKKKRRELQSEPLQNSHRMELRKQEEDHLKGKEAHRSRLLTAPSLAGIRVPTGEREPHWALLTGCIVATPPQTLPPGARSRTFSLIGPFSFWWGINSHQDSLRQTPDPLKRNSAFRGRCLLLWRKSSAKKEMILILIETRFTALSSLTRNMGLEISSHGLVAANSQVSKILNWHESTNTINNGVPLTFTTDILKCETFSFDSQLPCRAKPLLVFRSPYTFFFPALQVFTQSSATGSLAGLLSRLAAGFQLCWASSALRSPGFN